MHITGSSVPEHIPAGAVLWDVATVKERLQCDGLGAGVFNPHAHQVTPACLDINAVQT